MWNSLFRHLWLLVCKIMCRGEKIICSKLQYKFCRTPEKFPVGGHSHDSDPFLNFLMVQLQEYGKYIYIIRIIEFIDGGMWMFIICFCFLSLQMDRVPRTCCAKVFIQRDYSEGTFCRFQTKFPPELEGKVWWSTAYLTKIFV